MVVFVCLFGLLIYISLIYLFIHPSCLFVCLLIHFVDLFYLFILFIHLLVNDMIILIMLFLNVQTHTKQYVNTQNKVSELSKT